MRQFLYTTLILTLFAASACRQKDHTSAQMEQEEEQHTIIYGIIADDYKIETDSVGKGETMGKILNKYGISPAKIDALDKVAKDIFPLNRSEPTAPTPHLS